MKKYYYTDETSNKLKSIKNLPVWQKEYPDFGNQIKLMREVLGLTQEQLGKMINSTGRIIRKIENKEMTPTVHTLTKIASALNTDLKIMLVPRKLLKEFLNEKAEKKAREILKMAKSNSAMEIQSPSKQTEKKQLADLKKDILENKRNILWQK